VSKLDIFELYNPLQSGQKKSRIQHLTDICAYREEWALEAIDRLDNLGDAHVAVFFQLPMPIFVEDTVYKMPALRADTQIKFQFKPFLFLSTLSGRVEIQTAPAETRANSTQVIAYVPLWGRWAEAFYRYEHCFTANGMKDEIIMNNKIYWGGRTLRAKDFEYELATRIECEVEYALRRFLKSYSTVVKAQYAETEGVYSSFMMPYPGRLSQYGKSSRPLVSYFLNQTIVEPGARIDAERILRGVEFTLRKFSRFEIQIFELNRLVRSGNHALALAGALSLTEWLLRLCAPKEVKQLQFVRLIDYFSTRGLADDRPVLDEFRKLRNAVIHLGEHSGSIKTRPYEIVSIDIDQAISQGTALEAIELAWRVFKKANSGALSE